jgi:hypothetical protein
MSDDKKDLEAKFRPAKSNIKTEAGEDHGGSSSSNKPSSSSTPPVSRSESLNSTDLAKIKTEKASTSSSGSTAAAQAQALAALQAQAAASGLSGLTTGEDGSEMDEAGARRALQEYVRAPHMFSRILNFLYAILRKVSF